MIGYTTLGVRDLESAKRFYTELFDAKVLLDIGRLAMIGKSVEQTKIAVCIPYNAQDPHPGNGVMVAFPGGSKEGVDALYHKAIELGATCDGEPGQRIDDVFYGAYVRDFYGAYVRDHDGNKLCFFDFS